MGWMHRDEWRDVVIVEQLDGWWSRWLTVWHRRRAAWAKRQACDVESYVNARRVMSNKLRRLVRRLASVQASPGARV